MNITVLNPCGAEITSLKLTSVTDADVAQLRRLLAQHGVLVLPGQHAGDREFVDFLGRFGKLTFTAGETPVEGFPDLNVISNVGRKTTPRSVFHVDTSYVRRPPVYTALRTVRIPERGGETLFTNQYRAYETLPGDLRRRLAGRTIRHVVTGVDAQLSADAETQAEHPVFRTHPLSGRTSLYLSTPERCVSISGMDDEEAHNLIAFLYAHSTSAENTFQHSWSPGDVVIWDNGVVMHRADHSVVEGDRVMHRGMVAA